jgi:hypothetical protein
MLLWISMAMCIFGFGYGYAGESLFWTIMGVVGFIGIWLAIFLGQISK